ncbi:prepilin-type N-terminal cleavage/methylation domain-containing protein [Marinomonas sp. M1K-6]|uniref:Prepilin-type N-terminal cleavage/methylation domain-containing protein n=1 Tax=Marinomonas profundi TaxID=2726122 RepID=A0A847RCS2_9GAMM|nr:pilin [Marinomonas profundi]NLQ18824.1 prepilin-type N-terminal cleavage/methylation domain-containing protein [Marinomonas profundi]UDV02970.1 pilin [Marinomonas profundi]
MLLFRHTQRGFTLLELMVVIAIISILASLSAPTFTRQITKAKLIEAQNLATQHQSLVEEFILLHGSFPSTAEFNLIKHSLDPASLVKSITVEDQDKEVGNIQITLNDNTGITEGQYLKYSRDANRNWHCTSDLEANVLPQQCESLANTGDTGA